MKMPQSSRRRGRGCGRGRSRVNAAQSRVRSTVNASALSCRRTERSQQLVNVKVARDMLRETGKRTENTTRTGCERAREGAQRTNPGWAPSATSICKLRLWASLPEQATMGQQVASEMRRPRQQQLPQSEMEMQTELQQRMPHFEEQNWRWKVSDCNCDDDDDDELHGQLRRVSLCLFHQLRSRLADCSLPPFALLWQTKRNEVAKWGRGHADKVVANGGLTEVKFARWNCTEQENYEWERLLSSFW